MWDWWDDTVDTVSDAVSSGWDTVSDWSGDAYDTASDWVSNAAQTVYDTVDPYFTETWDALGDAWDWTHETVDIYLWDTTDKEAKLEAPIRDFFDIPDQEGKGFAEEAGEKIDTSVTTYIDGARTTIGGAVTTVNNYYEEAKGKIGDIINQISITLGVGMEAAFAALGSLPDLVKSAFTINLETYVVDGLKLYAANKALVERIRVEEELLRKKESV